MKVPCICIDDSEKPDVILKENWVVRGTRYHITHVYFMSIQAIQGVDLAEIDTHNEFFPCYKLSRFAFREEDILLLFALMKECSELNNVQIKELLKECNVVTVE